MSRDESNDSTARDLIEKLAWDLDLEGKRTELDLAFLKNLFIIMVDTIVTPIVALMGQAS
jgi:hypothetical protein